MTRQTYLKRRGAVYWLRARVPADLVAHCGKREHWISLRTRDPNDAARLALPITHKCFNLSPAA
jgi:hypothetical protein